MIGGFIGAPIGGVITDSTSIAIEAAVLSFAGQYVGLPLVVSPATLSLAGQAAVPTLGLPVSPSLVIFAGQYVGLPLVVTAASLIIAGQDVAVTPLIPSRNRAPLKLPRPEERLTGRLASYWRGMRNRT